MSDDRDPELYAASYRRLLGQLIGVTGSVAEAEDVLQEAFVRGLDHPRRLGADNPEAWLRTVAVNLARSRWRRAQRLIGLAPRLVEEPRDGDIDGHVDLLQALRTASGRPARGDRAAPPGRPVGGAGGRHARPADRDGQGTTVRGRAALSDLLVEEDPMSDFTPLREAVDSLAARALLPDSATSSAGPRPAPTATRRLGRSRVAAVIVASPLAFRPHSHGRPSGEEPEPIPNPERRERVGCGRVYQRAVATSIWFGRARRPTGLRSLAPWKLTMHVPRGHRTERG